LSLTWATILDEARKRSGDSDSSNLVTSDASALVKFNSLYSRWQAANPQRARFLTAAQSGLTASIGSSQIDTTNVKLLRIYRLFVASGVAFTSEVEKIEPWQILVELEENAGATGTPTAWSYIELGTDTAASVGIKRILLNKSADIAYTYGVYADVENSALVLTSDVPDVQEFVAHGLALELAAYMSEEMGQTPELTQAIRSEVPDVVQAAMGRRASVLRPSQRPMEEVA